MFLTAILAAAGAPIAARDVMLATVMCFALSTAVLAAVLDIATPTVALTFVIRHYTSCFFV